MIKGNFSKLTFNIKNESILVKYIYAPNNDMNLSGPDNESRIFFQKVFDDTYDTSGYLHVNNPSSRDYLTRNIEKCNLTDIWRLKNPKSRQYTFEKKTDKKLH